MKKLFVLFLMVSPFAHAEMNGKLVKAVMAYRHMLETKNNLSCYDLKSEADEIGFRCVNVKDFHFGVQVNAQITDTDLELDVKPFYADEAIDLNRSFGDLEARDMPSVVAVILHVANEVLEGGNCSSPDPSSVTVANKTWDTITCIGIDGTRAEIKRTIKQELIARNFLAFGGYDSLGVFVSTIRVSLFE